MNRGKGRRFAPTLAPNSVPGGGERRTEAGVGATVPTLGSSSILGRGEGWVHALAHLQPDYSGMTGGGGGEKMPTDLLFVDHIARGFLERTYNLKNVVSHEYHIQTILWR